MVAGMLTMGLYSALPAMPLPCTTNAVFSWMPTCAAHQSLHVATVCRATCIKKDGPASKDAMLRPCETAMPEVMTRSLSH